MKTRSTRLAAGLAGLALLASACSYTREDAVNDLVDEGLPQDTAECVMDEMEGAGYEASELTGDLSVDENAAMEDAMFTCASGDDLGSVLANQDPEELRASFIEGMTQSGLTEEQANCVVDSLEADGLSIIDLTQAGFDNDLDAIESELGTAMVACM